MISLSVLSPPFRFSNILFSSYPRSDVRILSQKAQFPSMTLFSEENLAATASALRNTHDAASIFNGHHFTSSLVFCFFETAKSFNVVYCLRNPHFFSFFPKSHVGFVASLVVPFHLNLGSLIITVPFPPSCLSPTVHFKDSPRPKLSLDHLAGFSFG